MNYSNSCILLKSYFAFNINIIYTLKNTFIAKIYLSESNIKTTNTQLIIAVNKLLIPLKIQKKIFLGNYLDMLKFSGCIQSIEFIKIIVDNKKYLKLCIQFNPIVKTIKIKNYQVLLISSNKLHKIFQPHIGLPLNYKLFNKSLNNILQWYKLQGFEWTRIQINYNKKLNNINLKIVEGQLLSSQVLCNNIFRTIKHQLINSIIQAEITQLYGQVLNKNILESKLQVIKKTYLLSDISYKIIYCPTGLSMLIKYITIQEKDIKISYISHYIYDTFNFFIYSYIKFIIHLYKTQNIFIGKYKFKYIINSKVYMQYYSSIYTKIHCINAWINEYIQSLKFYKFFSTFFVYSFKVLWTTNQWNYLKQKLFVHYCFNVEINSDYYLNKHIKYMQRFYYLVSQYYNNHISIYTLQNSIYKYKQKVFNHISIHIIQFTFKKYIYFFHSFVNLIIQNSYCFLLYLDNHYNKYHLKMNHFFHFHIYQIVILQVDNISWNFKLHINNLNFVFNKFKLLKILFINSNHICKLCLNPSSYFYFHYFVLINKYYKLYILSNYIYHTTLYKSGYFMQQYKNFVGLGIQINIPFQKVKYIRLKYILNIKQTMYLFIDKSSI